MIYRVQKVAMDSSIVNILVTIGSSIALCFFLRLAERRDRKKFEKERAEWLAENKEISKWLAESKKSNDNFS
jgi:hypothetical protein